MRAVRVEVVAKQAIGADVPGGVLSAVGATGKIRPEPDRENAFAGASGGGEGTGIERSLPPNTLELLVSFAYCFFFVPRSFRKA